MIHEVIKKYAVLPNDNNGYHVEINRVSWNDRKGRIEIRRWKNSDGTPGKGLSFTDDEFERLSMILPEVVNRL